MFSEGGLFRCSPLDPEFALNFSKLLKLGQTVTYRSLRLHGRRLIFSLALVFELFHLLTRPFHHHRVDVAAFLFLARIVVVLLALPSWGNDLLVFIPI